MAQVRIMVSRHAVFYSPLIGTIAAGFLHDEGVEATYDVLAPGQRSHELIRNGVVDVMQSAVSSNWKPLEAGIGDLPMHFAQINRRDGFFLVGRRRDDQFNWTKLEGAALVADHGLQPLVMLKYAARYNGVCWAEVQPIDAGPPEAMAAAFRSGRGDYVHLQGPAAQQLEYESAGYIVTSVGASMPPVAFSSLCAGRKFLESEAAKALVRAYRRGREWAQHTPPEDIARAEAAYFPSVSLPALIAAVTAYQKLGCWEGDLTIPPELYAQSLEVFGGEIARRHAYEEVVAPPPE